MSVTLNPGLTDLIVKALPPAVRDLLEFVGPRLLVAGGFCRDVLRSEEPRDIDIFARSHKALFECIEKFDDGSYRRKETANAITFFPAVAGEGINVQFVKRAYYRTFAGTISSFDFSICQVGVYFDEDTDHCPCGGNLIDVPGIGPECDQAWKCPCPTGLHNGWRGICSPEFFEDLTSLKMRYTAPDRDEDPGASVLRMVRFAERGFHIEREDIARCIGRFVSRIDQDYVGSELGMTNDEATNFVKEAFKRIGYAGKKIVTDSSEDYPF